MILPLKNLSKFDIDIFIKKMNIPEPKEVIKRDIKFMPDSDLFHYNPKYNYNLKKFTCDKIVKPFYNRDSYFFFVSSSYLLKHFIL